MAILGTSCPVTEVELLYFLVFPKETSDYNEAVNLQFVWKQQHRVVRAQDFEWPVIKSEAEGPAPHQAH